jgi:predicted RNA binding protein YcfA (HicA-like mRNA interferase family)
LVDGYYSAVVKLLRLQGYRYMANAKGSHEKWQNDAGKIVIVPRNLMSRHTANGILRDAGSSTRL